jgi:hypothetical protein
VCGNRRCHAWPDRCRSWRRCREAADCSPRGRKILFRIGKKAFFVHGFAKNEQDNIRDDELAAFKLLAAEMMAYDDEALAKAIANGTLTEVMCND